MGKGGNITEYTCSFIGDGVQVPGGREVLTLAQDLDSRLRRPRTQRRDGY
jgi:hypothetical protein